MEDLSLHILDIVENAIAAKADRIEISIIEESKEDRLVIEIKDDGIGMDEEVSQKAVDPFFTTRTSRRVVIVSIILPRGFRSIWWYWKVAVTLVPFPNSDSIRSIPPASRAA